ncbi:MAG TPA: GxxExxY protein [Rhodopila sp.]|nr:GxxExxY protein [Rhodopila sp.]
MRQSNPNGAALDAISNVVIGRALVVSKTLRTGFLEKIYENALVYELRKAGLKVSQQHSVSVYYESEIVGTYVVDLLVEGALMVELKAVRILEPIHKAQCLNYLKATGLPLCLLINFGNPRLDIRRVVNNF